MVIQLWAMQRRYIMSLVPYIEVYPFVNSNFPTYPRNMWQVVEKDVQGNIIKALTAKTEKEAEVIKYQFQQSK